VHTKLVGGTVSITPAAGQIERFSGKFEKLCETAEAAVAVALQSHKLPDRSAALQAIAETWSYGRSWYSSFSMCHNRLELFDMVWSPTMSLLSPLGLSSIESLNHYLPGAKKCGGDLS